MPKLHVLLKKEELDGQLLPGKVVIVLDVLFATTSIATALAHGATEVFPTLDGDAARAMAAGRPAGSFVLAGEFAAETLPGFAHPTPLALLDLSLSGRTLIYSTTNGTVAVRKAAGASRVYAAALGNGAAVVEHVVRRAQGETVLLVCSGSVDAVNLEDFYGAGHLVSHFTRSGTGFDLSDTALAAQILHDGSDALDCLSRSRVGRMMIERGLRREVEYAARKDHLAVVPELSGGRLVNAAA
ncbi:MAG: 2-phosphosulfolactate phosphatase [Deltaproteobacteria bacterium]|nr:2-phosphosulfolactate phosphatase [Deltaproteobacteria bacterium]